MGIDRFGYCGLDCAKCPVFVATQNDDNDLRQKTAIEWTNIYREFLDKDLLAENMNCLGCKSNSKDIFIGCQACQIKSCCSNKGAESCKECGQFSNCEVIQGFLSFHEIKP